MQVSRSRAGYWSTFSPVMTMIMHAKCEVRKPLSKTRSESARVKSTTIRRTNTKARFLSVFSRDNVCLFFPMFRLARSRALLHLWPADQRRRGKLASIGRESGKGRKLFFNRFPPFSLCPRELQALLYCTGSTPSLPDLASTEECPLKRQGSRFSVSG